MRLLYALKERGNLRKQWTVLEDEKLGLDPHDSRFMPFM